MLVFNSFILSSINSGIIILKNLLILFENLVIESINFFESLTAIISKIIEKKLNDINIIKKVILFANINLGGLLKVHIIVDLIKNSSPTMQLFIFNDVILDSNLTLLLIIVKFNKLLIKLSLLLFISFIYVTLLIFNISVIQVIFVCSIKFNFSIGKEIISLISSK